MTLDQPLTEYVEGLVHKDTQLREDGVDLTVASVSEVDDPGRVDFGGDEMRAAGTTPVETRQRNPGDDYGWWNLSRGEYLVEFNESLDLPNGERVVVQVREQVRARGVSHPTLHTDTLGTMPLTVGGAGIRIKENARLSTIVREACGASE